MIHRIVFEVELANVPNYSNEELLSVRVWECLKRGFELEYDGQIEVKILEFEKDPPKPNPEQAKIIQDLLDDPRTKAARLRLGL